MFYLFFFKCFFQLYFLFRAKYRTDIQKEFDKLDDETYYSYVKKKCVTKLRHTKQYTALASQPGDERPLSACKFSPTFTPFGANDQVEGHALSRSKLFSSAFFLIGSWSGTVGLWNVPSCSRLQSYYSMPIPFFDSLISFLFFILVPNPRNCHSIAWHRHTFDPYLFLSEEKTKKKNSLFVSGYADGRIALFSLNEFVVFVLIFLYKPIFLSSKPISLFEGHNQRASSLHFHPFLPSLLLSTGYDRLWKMWDIEYQGPTQSKATGKGTSGSMPVCLLSQEGHADSIHVMAVHPDGSLIATGYVICFNSTEYFSFCIPFSFS